MNKRISALGWIMAGALGITMVASGFQATGVKIGIVDMQRILADSAAGKKMRDDMSTQVNLRQGLLEFVNTNKVLTADQAGKLKDLTLKPGATQADKDALEKLKSDIRAEAKKFNDLMVKPTLTDTERTAFNDLNSRRQASDTLLNQWNQEFSNDLTNIQDEMIGNVLKKAREAVQAMGKKDGYSVVFPNTVAIYGANDLTDQAIKAVDEAK